MQSYHIIGVMSGTSLDGVDLAYCYFTQIDGKWKFEIKDARTIPYKEEWREKLKTVHNKDAFTFAKTHSEFGRYLGKLVADFKKSFQIDFVSSHGHTIFHQPDGKFTFQLGEGAALSAECNLPVVCDFRTTDIALGGQGAPLVPIGDKLLFQNYTYCLNLGGIANISFELDRLRLAYDICPVNFILNDLSGQAGKLFDKNGEMASAGKVDNDLLEKLNRTGYYSRPFPKSLGREDIEQDFLPIINSSTISLKDKLCTFCEHVAIQIAHSIQESKSGSKMLITGGGAYNTFLIERIKEYCSGMEVIIPEEQIIEFKEALIFAFLGVLRWRSENNCLRSVTGARRDSCGGAIYLP